jgi:hypothetical protein
MSFLSDLIMKLLRWFYELSQKDLPQEDAQKDEKLRQDLRARIDAHERELLIESDLRAQRAASEIGRGSKSPSVGFRFKRPESKIKE